VLVLNKADLADEWEITDGALAELTRRGLDIVRTSAKTGTGVGEAFGRLAAKILGT